MEGSLHEYPESPSAKPAFGWRYTTEVVGNREQYGAGNSTVTPVVSNLHIDPD